MLTLVLTSSACASGTGFDGKTFRNDELAFQVNGVPTTWRKLDADAALLAFRDDTSQATVSVNGRSGKDGDDVHLRIPISRESDSLNIATAAGIALHRLDEARRPAPRFPVN